MFGVELASQWSLPALQHISIDPAFGNAWLVSILQQCPSLTSIGCIISPQSETLWQGVTLTSSLTSIKLGGAPHSHGATAHFYSNCTNLSAQASSCTQLELQGSPRTCFTILRNFPASSILQKLTLVWSHSFVHVAADRGLDKLIGAFSMHPSLCSITLKGFHNTHPIFHTWPLGKIHRLTASARVLPGSAAGASLGRLGPAPLPAVNQLSASCGSVSVKKHREIILEDVVHCISSAGELDAAVTTLGLASASFRAASPAVAAGEDIQYRISFGQHLICKVNFQLEGIAGLPSLRLLTSLELIQGCDDLLPLTGVSSLTKLSFHSPADWDAAPSVMVIAALTQLKSVSLCGSFLYDSELWQPPVGLLEFGLHPRWSSPNQVADNLLIPRVNWALLRNCSGLQILRVGQAAVVFDMPDWTYWPKLKHLEMDSIFVEDLGELPVYPGLDGLTTLSWRHGATPMPAGGLAHMTNLQRLRHDKFNPSYDEAFGTAPICWHLPSMDTYGHHHHFCCAIIPGNLELEEGSPHLNCKWGISEWLVLSYP